MDNLVTLQDLFKNSIFKIPDYQRGYSWENVHSRDLLNDLEAIQVSSIENEKERRHYTGTVVLQPTGIQSGFGESYKKYDVVDGQQRLTTILILLKTTIEELRGITGAEEVEAQKVANNIEERYLTVDGPQGRIFKLSLDEDNDFFSSKRFSETRTPLNPQSGLTITSLMQKINLSPISLFRKWSHLKAITLTC